MGHTSAFAAVLVATLSLSSRAGDLAEAKKKLEAPDEATFSAGARLCLEANDAEGAELLLRRLAGAQPHMRDIAFEHLERFTNPYAMAVVEQAATGHKDE